MKECQKCNIEKPFGDFHKNRRAKDGLNRWCKSCKKQADAKRREEKRDHLNAQSRAWKARNRKGISDYNKQYYQEHLPTQEVKPPTQEIKQESNNKDSKLCRKCDTEKPLSGFNKDSSKKSGVQSQCRSCFRDYNANYYQENKEERLKAHYQWRKDNPEKVQAQQKRHSEKYREQLNEKSRAYSKTEAGRIRNRRGNNARRARLAGTFSERIPDSFYEVLRQKQNNECRYCGVSFDEVAWTEEHVTPISRKGPDIRGNLALACLSCNSSKLNKTHEEFLEYLKL